MQEKKFKLSKEEITQVIKPSGSCVSSDKVTIDGMRVGYMYREMPDFDTDSGWRFFSGIETQEYIDNPDNMMIYDINTIANYDPAIIPYLKMQIGSELERQNNGTFEIISSNSQ